MGIALAIPMNQPPGGPDPRPLPLDDVVVLVRDPFAVAQAMGSRDRHDSFERTTLVPVHTPSD